jgi:hypothetical protein
MSNANKNGLPVTGIWIRNGGDDGRTVVVLAEVRNAAGAREWRKVFEQSASDFGEEGMVSHIVEPLGIESSPVDDLPSLDVEVVGAQVVDGRVRVTMASKKRRRS